MRYRAEINWRRRENWGRRTSASYRPPPPFYLLVLFANIPAALRRPSGNTDRQYADQSGSIRPYNFPWGRVLIERPPALPPAATPRLSRLTARAGGAPTFRPPAIRREWAQGPGRPAQALRLCGVEIPDYGTANMQRLYARLGDTYTEPPRYRRHPDRRPIGAEIYYRARAAPPTGESAIWVYRGSPGLLSDLATALLVSLLWAITDGRAARRQCAPAR